MVHDGSQLPTIRRETRILRHLGLEAWKDIWGCGQGIGAIREVVPAAALVSRFKREYTEARARICVG